MTPDRYWCTTVPHYFNFLFNMWDLNNFMGLIVKSKFCGFFVFFKFYNPTTRADFHLNTYLFICLLNDINHCISLFAELHVFSGPEVSNQSVHSHPAGSHHSLPRTWGSGGSAVYPCADYINQRSDLIRLSRLRWL